MIEPEGHLFIIHGRIESVIHDAALVPVDQAYDFNPIWAPLVGERPLLPAHWTERGYGRIRPAPDRVWAVSIGNGLDPYDAVIDRVIGALRRIELRRDAHPPTRGSGALPLVAVPVIGIGRGGYAGDRGTVLRMLVERLAQASRELRIDVVLVTPDPAVFAAAQYARRRLTKRLQPRLESLARELGTAARDGQLAILMGAGASAAAGLPSWQGLLEHLERDIGITYPDPKQVPSSIDRAELIERKDKEGFQQSVAAMVTGISRPSLLHALLASLDCHEVVTTNYDTLYEQAVRATDREIQAVMPWNSAHGADRWILKLHGDVEHVKQIVLTRRHMVRYDAANRPSAAVLQSLLLTKRLLAVGVSMTDDNVIRLAHEVQAYREEHQKGEHRTFGTVLDTDGDDIREALWAGQLDWVKLAAEAGLPGRRAQELFLDRVAGHAARDSSWLLDQRFEGLLDCDEDRQLSAAVRDLYHRLPAGEGNKWTPLVRRLEELGASSGNRIRFPG
ncbi:SIR2 family NAD-dependent protein deacylase [Nocardioides pacificus]